MSVTEIVFEGGFEERAHFTRAFKARFGRPPSEYRAARGRGRLSAILTGKNLTR